MFNFSFPWLMQFVIVFLYVNIHIILTEEKTLLKLELRLTVGDIGAC